MSKVIDSTIEYALEYLGTVAKQVDGMRIPDRTWTYMLSRMDTLDTLQSIVQDSMSQHAAWINQSLMMINEEPLDIVGWQMLIQDISSDLYPYYFTILFKTLINKNTVHAPTT